MITLLPFVSFPICLILEKYNLKKSSGWLFAFASIIISRFWFTINTPDIEQEFIAENFLKFRDITFDGINKVFYPLN